MLTIKHGDSIYTPSKMPALLWQQRTNSPILTPFGVFIGGGFTAYNSWRMVEKGLSLTVLRGILVTHDNVLTLDTQKVAKNKKAMFTTEPIQGEAFYVYAHHGASEVEVAMAAWYASGHDLKKTLAFLTERDKGCKEGYVEYRISDLRELIDGVDLKDITEVMLTAIPA